MMSTGTYAWIENGVVTNLILWDGNSDPETGGLLPPDGVVLALVGPGQTAYIGFPATQDEDGVWAFSTPPPPPPPTVAEIVATNTSTRNALLSAATNAIAPLQDAVDLGVATSGEETMLTKWKQYRVAVNRVDLSLPSPAWPIPPAPLSYAVTPGDPTS